MKTVIPLIRSFVLTLLVLAGFAASSVAQTVSIPDPGLNAAVRQALNKPAGPLTEQDLLSLTNLDARNRNIASLQGLEAARNLASLDLVNNHLINFLLPQLTNLSVLDLTGNPLTSSFLVGGPTNLTSLIAEGCGLTNLTIPTSLTRLTNLDVEVNNLSSFNPPANLASLVFLDLGFNSFTNFSLPGGLTNLDSFYFAGNPLTNVTLPPDLSGLTELNLSQNLLTQLTLPTGMINLDELDLSFNLLTNLTLPADLQNLNDLDLDSNQLTILNFPSNLTNLSRLHLRSNLFTNFTLPAGLTGLAFLDVSDGPLRAISLPAGLNHLSSLRIRGNTNLTSLILPVGMTNLTGLNLTGNRLTNVVLAPDLNQLRSLDLSGNLLTSLTLPPGLTNLTGLFVGGNLLTNLTLPPDLMQLTELSFLSNPLTTLVLSEPLAASTNFTVNLTTIASLPSQGVSVFTYPLMVQLVRPLQLVGAFKFGITGPPGTYTVFGSTNLATWSVVGVATNPLGSVNFHDVTANVPPQKFYRALLQSPPPNMVFIPPNTFTMGSPTNELHRQANEGPQTTVTLTRGFWIGKYEVTQGEYLDVTGTNPSQFPGDLSRPISSVSWPDATNYCWLLTQRELAAGHIPAGSRYRLPTEAEWECAARAGTTTRFSYGDDPDYASLTNYAWQTVDDGLTVHPVGQKLPNPWGLYDMYGNVLEWCQDWFGPLFGGAVTDPTGPASSPVGDKVMRGGAFDFGAAFCRSASRLGFGNHPALNDWDLGFRVVLAPDSP